MKKRGEGVQLLLTSLSDEDKLSRGASRRGTSHTRRRVSVLNAHLEVIEDSGPVGKDLSSLASETHGSSVGRTRPCSRYTEKSRRSTVKIFRIPSRSATRRIAASARSIGRLAYLRISSRIRGASPTSSAKSCKAPRSRISQRASCARG